MSKIADQNLRLAAQALVEEIKSQPVPYRIAKLLPAIEQAIADTTPQPPQINCMSKWPWPTSAEKEPMP